MNPNAQVITLLCSHLCDEDCQPLEPSEWSALASRMVEKNCTPEDFLRFEENDITARMDFNKEEAARITRLLDRAGSMEFELARYENMGISVLTRADAAYPNALKKKLKNTCPPLFYYAGDLKLLERALAGYVGARTVTEQDEAFTRRTVEKTVSRGYGVVTGGAKGVDRIATQTALSLGSDAVEFPAESMLKKLRQTDDIRAIQNGKLLLLSVAKPDAGFQVGVAMMRNRYIYAQSCGTVVVRSDLNKGGTWAGATDNLRHDWCPTFCWNHAYPGNQALIREGAIIIDEDWTGDMANIPDPVKEEQMRLF